MPQPVLFWPNPKYELKINGFDTLELKTNCKMVTDQLSDILRDPYLNRKYWKLVSITGNLANDYLKVK